MTTPDDEVSTRRFSSRAADYARFRPGYPPAAIDAILAGLPPPTALAIADVAAGTGIASRLLADRGARVIAVEPNAEMRGAAAPHAGVAFVDGTAEATGLADATVDVVTAAQAFHWFDVPSTLREFHRILRPGGRVALLWNRRRRDDPFTLGYRAALAAIDAEAPADRHHFDPAAVTQGGLFAALGESHCDNPGPLSLDELIGRAMSTSTVPRSGPRHDTLMAALRALHARFAGADGRATMVYRTDVFLFRRT
ncbi:MAG: class I SAM-dependent methyltransferase [Planctomycetota bacterium]